MNILELIHSHTPRMADGECWITDLKLTEDNRYPRLQGRRLHRVAWEAFNAEPIPQGMLVRHTCDNPACINPEHLILGTHQDNSDDMLERRRGNHTTLYALTEDDYQDIFNSDEPTSHLAKQYGVSAGHIRRIRRTGSGKQPSH